MREALDPAMNHAVLTLETTILTPNVNRLDPKARQRYDTIHPRHAEPGDEITSATDTPYSHHGL